MPPTTEQDRHENETHEIDRRELEQLKRERDEERRKRQEAEERNRQAEERSRQDEARRKEAETRTAVLEKERSSTPFLEYVRYTEDILFQTFHIKPALLPTSPSQGSSTKSYTTTSFNGKFYPRFLRQWTDYENSHVAMFQTLVATFGDRPLFPAMTDVQGVGRELSPEVADEQDLRPFIRTAIEKPAARIVTQYLRITGMQEDETRKNPDTHRDGNDDGGDGSGGDSQRLVRIHFQNNAYGLDLGQDERLETTSQNDDETHPAKRRRSPVKQIGVPDRWCVGKHANDSITHVLVGEYKAAHKLPAKKLSRVFSQQPDENFFSQAIDTTSVATKAKKTPPLQTESVYIAKVLCQAYHYMILSGLEFGYVASGDGLIFLRVLEHDPQTLHYFWSVFTVPLPGQEARVTDREPQKTALAYLASLCMMAIRSPVRPMSWIAARQQDLARWPNPYLATERLALLPRLGTDGGAGQGNGGGSGEGGSGGGSTDSRDAGDAAPGNSGGPGARGPNLKRSRPSDGPSTGTTTHTYVIKPPEKWYCTQACLRGLANGGPLDERCPNVGRHRAARPAHGSPGRHLLTATDVCRRIVNHLSQPERMDIDCECLDKWGLFGATGVLFKLSVTGYGYTFVAKGVRAGERDALETEAAVYAGLSAFQGVLIPVFLGVVDLAQPLPLHSLARIGHMMLLSYAGGSLPRNVGPEEVERTSEELAEAGLYNDDEHPGNVAWNKEVGRVMQFDFGHAIMQKPSPLAKRNFNALSSDDGSANYDSGPTIKRQRSMVGDENTCFSGLP